MTKMKELKKISEKDLQIASLEGNERRLQKEIHDFNQRLMVFEKKLLDSIERLELKLTQTQKIIKESNKLNDNVDCTLRNVLLAIRQNEYLQSWHPEQAGFPEMKVVGKHPVQ